MQASVTCALTGPLQIADYKAIAGAEGHEVFSERKGLNLFQNKVSRCSANRHCLSMLNMACVPCYPSQAASQLLCAVHADTASPTLVR